MKNMKYIYHHKKLLAVVSKGRNKVAVTRRAHNLLKSDEGKTDAEFSQALYISGQTVQRTRTRDCEEDLELRGLSAAPRSFQRAKGSAQINPKATLPSL